MKGTRILLLTLAAPALLTSACRKKSEPEKPSADLAPPTAHETRSGELPPNPAIPMPTPLGGRPTGEGAAMADAPAAATVVPEGVSPEVAASDVAYEAWFKKYNLDLTNPLMLEEDTDGDGFNNREEFLAETDPRDPNSIPGVHPALRLKSFTRKDLPYMLRSVEGETARIEHTGDGETKTEALAPGETLPGTNYKVTRVRSGQARDKDGKPFDASRVTLEDSRSKQRLDLVKDMPARSGESFAVITSAGGAQNLTVREGETFSWPDEPSSTYRVRELRAEQVILEDLNSGKVWTVPKL